MGFGRGWRGKSSLAKMRHKQFVLFLLAFAVVFFLLLSNSPESRKLEFPPDRTPTESLKTEEGIRVTWVVDGDTIEIEGGTRIRYIGIDTPEYFNSTGAVSCSGKEALEKNKQLVFGKNVTLEKDVSEKDQFGRLLRYVWIDGEMVNEILVREGYARAIGFPPDEKYQERFIEAERKSREEGKGFWGEVCEGLP